MARLHAAALLFALAAPALAQNCSAPGPGNNTASVHFKAVSDYLDLISDDLWPLNKEIHDNPELGYEEVQAHDLLTSFMESQDGWNVTRSLGGIDTAFMAVFEGSGEGPVVSFNAEYDALPGLGHACGHNLIATASVGGALATAEIMRAESLAGRVILFGTPAEESLGGKVKMLEAGLFDDAQIDISLISHPTAGNDSPYMITTATDRFDVEYHGREAHAAAGPWEGINAQDALLVANTALGFMRQQMRPSDKVHGFIASGGSRINVIPALATASYQIRSNDAEQLANFTERCRRGASRPARWRRRRDEPDDAAYGYANMVSNDALAGSYTTWFEGLGGDIEDPVIDKKRDPSGSTDQGNISHDFPSISPYFGITNEDGSQPAGGPHTTAFEVASGSRAAFDKAIMVAKSLAGVAVDVLTVEGLLEKIKEEFEQTKKSSKRKARR
ncbi:aminobenzoyl-glutamate utilization protein B [Verticillium alfalfae VaMs.102]|uniref:Peptidase M20 domain-containing protein 2 n=1 Tax=Verticillium alfalfae (strain VaMs.102 / ATCC MYA-4576 / FGSC 10136) TaxID=526221 RepID=C9SNJ3_VERA1|nr:aminobenzoyl-glutamate utilization protein B [Verticillium alfalfae VaMs.102]EEY20358.1 aminobenzoyl-glutamate utilization protein B [Verticillium alfalfae VaMs.102]